MIFNFAVPASVQDARAERQQTESALSALSYLQANVKPNSEAKPGDMRLHVPSDAAFRDWQTQADEAWIEHEARILFLERWIAVEIQRKDQNEAHTMRQP
jgi:hypothetical protein